MNTRPLFKHIMMRYKICIIHMLLMNDMNVQVSQPLLSLFKLVWSDDQTDEDDADEEGNSKTMMKLQYCACIHFAHSEWHLRGPLGPNFFQSFSFSLW